MSICILHGDALERLHELPEASVQCCVTSPPYWGMRDYGVAGQIGAEKTPEEFLERLVAVFAEVRRVLKNDGTCWVNMGDKMAVGRNGRPRNGLDCDPKRGGYAAGQPYGKRCSAPAKNILGLPWRLAFALQADGWILRQDIIWHKSNPMPESVRDRCTKAHEYLFLLSKRSRYYYNATAIAEPAGTGEQAEDLPDCYKGSLPGRNGGPGQERRSTKQRKPAGWDTGKGAHGAFHRAGRAPAIEYTQTARQTRNRRSVWTIPTSGFSEAHFATFPPALVEPCILAGSRPGDTVLDPFGGAGTTALVADRLGREAILVEISAEYAEMALARLRADCPLFAEARIHPASALDARPAG